MCQGGNASPIPFRGYLSDLKDYLDVYTWICIFNEIILHMLRTDDLYMVSCNTDHAQRQLDVLSKFCTPNQMVTNENQSKIHGFRQDQSRKVDIEVKIIKTNTII